MLSIGISDPCVCSKNVQTIQIMTSAKILFVYLRYRLQNIPYFCVFKYARAVKQKVWNEAENRERDWGETSYGRVRLARFARVRLLRHALPISLLILRKKNRLFCSLLKERKNGHRGRTILVRGRCQKAEQLSLSLHAESLVRVVPK